MERVRSLLGKAPEDYWRDVCAGHSRSIQDAEITGNCAVLDVATGPGEPALSITEVIGPQGKVVGTDAVPEMIEAARREGHRLGLRNASFEVAFDDCLPFPANTFDSVVSRFGVMFFASPVNSVREWLRILKPGGRVAMAVWHFAEKNPFFYVVSQVVDRYVDSPPPDADSPDAFCFANPGKLQAVLSNAGATATSERLLRFSIEASMRTSVGKLIPRSVEYTRRASTTSRFSFATCCFESMASLVRSFSDISDRKVQKSSTGSE